MMKFGKDDTSKEGIDDGNKADGVIKGLEVDDESSKDRVAALNQSLARSVVTGDDDKIELDDISMAGEGDSNKMAEANEEAKKEIEKLKKNCKISLKIQRYF